MYNIKSKENKGVFKKYIIGDSCASELLSFRFVAGVWCLAAFIFVQAYTSTLFTYVVTPNNPPLINSIYDIVESPDINLLVKVAGTPESMFLASQFYPVLVDESIGNVNIFYCRTQNNNWTGFYEKIRDRIKSYPHSRCTLVSECIDLVKPGLRNVFIDVCLILSLSIYYKYPQIINK